MIGQAVGRYRITGKLGAGGMGAVYAATHESMSQRAAIKVLHPQYSSDPAMVQRFLNEARAISDITHPGLVKIFDLGQLPDGTLFILMELLHGETLAARIARLRRVPPPEALRLTRQLASALVAAHQRGIIHRDLKPGNIMIVPDPEAPGGERAKLLDFGIAKVGQAQAAVGQLPRTQTGMIMGTPQYMAPEQCHGARDVTDRADVYSLGVILYEMLVGAPPFKADGLGELIALHLFEPPVPIGRHQVDIPREVEALVDSLLLKDPRRRPSMAQIEAMIQGLGSGSVTQERGAQPSTIGQMIGQVLPPSRPRSRSAASVLAAVAVVGIAAGLVLRASSQAPAPVAVAVVPAPHPEPPPAPPARVACRLDSQPSGALVQRGSELLGSTPLRWQQEVRAALRLKVTYPGHQDSFVVLDTQGDCQAAVLLVPVARRPPVAAPRSAPEKEYHVPVVR